MFVAKRLMGNRSLCQAFPSVDIVLLMEKTPPHRSDISAAGNSDNIGDREGGYYLHCDVTSTVMTDYIVVPLLSLMALKVTI